MKNIVTFYFTIIFLISSLTISAQSNSEVIQLTLLKGSVFNTTINSYFAPSATPSLNCNVSNISLVSPKLYQFNINPNNNNFVGKASVSMQYTEFKPPFSFLPKYTTYLISYVESIISTNPDFISVSGENAVTIKPLINDSSTALGLQLNGIGQVQNGQASFDGDSIIYNPVIDSKTDYIVYSVTDSLGSKASGLIYIIKEDLDNLVSDTLNYTIANTANQVIILPSTGFSLQNAPTKGVLAIVNSQVYKYNPNVGVSGNDVFTLNHTTGVLKTVIIKLINVTGNNSSVRNDKFYTAKNTSITFDVFANDISSNFSISAFSSSLVHDTLGIFTYSPPAGFSGEKNFTYTVNYGSYTSTGKIAIVIGNYAPQEELTYAFNTEKNTALAIEYQVPVSGYTFNLLTNPQFGSVEIFNAGTSLNIDCNTIQSNATIVYTPDNNYVGNDEFDLEYCVENNPCTVYKVYTSILNSQLDTVCICIGKDCVWPGDMNGDGRVSVSDLLALGRFLGMKGDARNDIAIPYWTGNHSTNWSTSLPNGTNSKYVDGDGDGLISANDLLTIDNNYSKIHTLVPNEVLAIKDYAFQLIPNTTDLDSGDLLILDIIIGNNSKPVIDAFGLAFALDFPASLVDSASVVGQFDESGWFGMTSPTLQLTKQPIDGKIHMGLTRTGGIGVSGNGKIGQLSFIVDDEADGFKSDTKYILHRLSTKNIEFENADGDRFLLPNTYIDVKINLDKKTPVPSEDKLLVYPNPTSNILNLHFNGRNIIKALSIYDLYGNLVLTRNNINEQAVSINTSALSNGLYILKTITTEGIITKKIEVITD